MHLALSTPSLRPACRRVGIDLASERLGEAIRLGSGDV
jgi:hypothetical protein